MATIDLRLDNATIVTLPAHINGTNEIDILRVRIDATGASTYWNIALDLSSPQPQNLSVYVGDNPHSVLLRSIERIDFESSPGSYGHTLFATGGNLADILNGGADSDTLIGGAGNDTLQGSPDRSATVVAADSLSGGAGNDTFLDVGAHNYYYSQSTISGGSGIDRFVMPGVPADVPGPDGYFTPTGRVTDFTAGAGGDVIALSQTLRDTYYTGNLRIVKDHADTVIEYLRYEDSFWGSGHTETPAAGWVWMPLVILQDVDKSDLVSANFDKSIELGNAQNGVFRGTNINDLFNGGFGDDSLVGGAGNDTLTGGQGNDTLDGGSGNDNLTGGYGDDRVYAVAGNDTVQGGFGNDRIDAGTGNDKISGDDGVDTLIGGDGDDRLDGGSSNDLIYGGAGNDTLISGTGNDTMWGGPGGQDVFKASLPLYADRDFLLFYDFQPGIDKIDLRDLHINPDDEYYGFYMIDGPYGAQINVTFDPYYEFHDHGLTITVSGISADQLDRSDFLF